MTGGFTGAIAFLDRLGVYDVVLPFLLVFTLMYAFLEKTRIFGTMEYFEFDDARREHPYVSSRKNLNAMVSFVTAFFVIASSQLVAIINQTLSHMILLLLLVFCFVLVAGSFQKQTDEGFFLQKGWKTTFMVITFVAILFIFLNALGWLEIIWQWILRVGSSDAIATVVLIALIVGFIIWIGRDPKTGSSSQKSEH